MRGWTNACSNEPPCAGYGLGTHPDGEYGGALSDFVRVPYADTMLVKLPESLSPEAGAGLSDNVADGYRTVADGLAQFPGEPVLVVGGLAQSVGLYAVQAARALGSTKIVYTDNDETRLLLAASVGAEAVRVEDYESAKRAEENFLITVVASVQPAGLAYAIRSTAPCGFCTGVSGGLTPTDRITVEFRLSARYYIQRQPRACTNRSAGNTTPRLQRDYRPFVDCDPNGFLRRQHRSDVRSESEGYLLAMTP